MINYKYSPIFIEGGFWMKHKFSLYIAMIFAAALCILTLVACDGKEESKECEHEWSSWQTVTEATCIKNGKAQRTCSDCDAVEEKDISATGSHSFISNICKECGEKRPTENLEYILTQADTAYLVSGIGTATDLNIVIPSTYKDLPVIGIAPEAFKDCLHIISVTIPSSVTVIGDSAFKDCLKLLEVHNLSSLNIELNSDEHGFISSHAHNVYTASSGKSNLVFDNDGLVFYTNDSTSYLMGYSGSDTAIILPDSCNGKNYKIFQYAFYQNQTLTSVLVPTSVSEIGKSAFEGCTNLTSITLPFVGNTLDDKTNNHFGYIFGASTYAWHKETVPASLKTVIITGGNINYGAFYECSNLTGVTLPSTLTSIGYESFLHCSSLTSITIPSTVTSIANYAFRYCSNLATVIFDGTSQLKTVGWGVFADCTALESITLPSTVTDLGWGTFFNCSRLVSVNIPSQVTYIGEYAFYNCTELNNIVIPAAVTSIGQCAFYGCESLRNITIPSLVTSIGLNAFKNSGITAATFENTANWRAETASSSITVSASNLEKLSNAATYLKSTYCDYTWKRS